MVLLFKCKLINKRGWLVCNWVLNSITIRKKLSVIKELNLKRVFNGYGMSVCEQLILRTSMVSKGCLEKVLTEVIIVQCLYTYALVHLCHCNVVLNMCLRQKRVPHGMVLLLDKQVCLQCFCWCWSGLEHGLFATSFTLTGITFAILLWWWWWYWRRSSTKMFKTEVAKLCMIWYIL